MLLLRHVWLSVTPWTVDHQASPSMGWRKSMGKSMGFSRQEYWSGWPFPSPGIFPIQGSNAGLLHCRQTLYHLNHQHDLRTTSNTQNYNIRLLATYSLFVWNSNWTGCLVYLATFPIVIVHFQRWEKLRPGKNEAPRIFYCPFHWIAKYSCCFLASHHRAHVYLSLLQCSRPPYPEQQQ